MNACPEKKAPVRVSEDPNIDLIRKWVNKPNAKHIKVHHLFNDRYRVNVFTGVKLPDCVVEKLTLSESYFVLVKNGKVIDKTTGRVIPQNLFK